MAKPTLRELRATAKRLGVTPESAGCPIEELIELVRDLDDPLGQLALYAPPPDPGDGQPLDPGDPDAAPPPDPPTPEEIKKAKFIDGEAFVGPDGLIDPARVTVPAEAPRPAKAEDAMCPPGVVERMTAERTAAFLATLSPKADTAEISVLSVLLPVVPVSARAYRPMHVDVRLSGNQAEALKAVGNALKKIHAVLADGRKVDGPNGAVRWLFEQVEAAMRDGGVGQ